MSPFILPKIRILSKQNKSMCLRMSCLKRLKQDLRGAYLEKPLWLTGLNIVRNKNGIKINTSII